MDDPREEAARAALSTVVSALEESSRRLRTIHDSLPVTPEERSRRDLDGDPAAATEMRAVIRNVLADSLQPAIEDLRAAAERWEVLRLEENRDEPGSLFTYEV